MSIDKDIKKQLLFEKVDCTAYLKKIHDGVFIKHITEAQAKQARSVCGAFDSDDFYTEAGWICFRKDGTYFLSPCEGAYDVEKIYYETVEKNFTGVCVGFVDVLTEGYLGVDVGYRFNGDEYEYVFKSPKTVITAAIVYYANNKKRLVPIKSIKK